MEFLSFCRVPSDVAIGHPVMDVLRRNDQSREGISRCKGLQVVEVVSGRKSGMKVGAIHNIASRLR